MFCLTDIKNFQTFSLKITHGKKNELLFVIFSIFKQLNFFFKLLYLVFVFDVPFKIKNVCEKEKKLTIVNILL